MSIIKRIKIVQVPQYNEHINDLYQNNINFENSVYLNTPLIPSLGIAQITAYLRQKKIIVELDDLNIKIHHDARTKKEKFDFSCVLNWKEVLNHIIIKENPIIKDFIQTIVKKTNFEGYDLICLSPMWPEKEPTFNILLLISNYLKQKYNIPIVVGGTQQNTCERMYELIEKGLELKVYDYVIVGQGEQPLYRLIKSLNKENEKLEEINGLMYLKNGKIIKQGFGETCFQMHDFEGLPLELYKWRLPQLINKKLGIKNKKILVLPYRFNIGCPYQCIFCGASDMSDFRVISPKKAVEEIKELSEKYNTKYFFFMSHTINISKKYILEFCDEIIKQNLNIYWSDCARVNNMDEEILKKMKKAGCIRLIYGLETGSKRMLKYINKRISLEQVSKVIRMTNNVDIWTCIEIIAGLPTETKQDVEDTINFLDMNKANLDNIFLTKYYLIQNSLLGTHPEKYGIKNIQMENDPMGSRKYKFDEIDGLNWEEKKKQIDYSYNKIYDFIKKERKNIINDFDEHHFLFLAYTVAKSKKGVKKFYMNYNNIASDYPNSVSTKPNRIRKMIKLLLSQ